MGECRRLAIVTFIICMVFSLRGRPGAGDGQLFVFTFCELREFIVLKSPKVVSNCTVLVALYVFFWNYQLGVVNSPFLMSRTFCFPNVIVLCYSDYILSFTETTHPAKLVLPLMSSK